MTTLEKLTKALELLDKAYQRKRGYTKWNPQAIWFSLAEQRKKVECIDMAINRIKQSCIKYLKEIENELIIKK